MVSKSAYTKNGRNIVTLTEDLRCGLNSISANPKVCPGGPPGWRNPKGGECNCDDPRVFSHNVYKKVLADGGKWREPWCFQGQCYSG